MKDRAMSRWVTAVVVVALVVSVVAFALTIREYGPAGQAAPAPTVSVTTTVTTTAKPKPRPTVTRTVTVNRYPMCGGDVWNLDPETQRRAEAAGGCIWRP